MNKKFYIKTFGCQMNVADSERMASLLAERGMTEAKLPEEADVILVNGCTVREKAVQKALSMLGTYGSIGSGGEKDVCQSASAADDDVREDELLPTPSIVTRRTVKPIIGVGGCVGQMTQGKIFKRAPYIDFVFGPDTIDNLPELLHRVENGEKHVVYAEFDKSMDYSTETKIHKPSAQAFVNIMKGCDKFCTYCIVPFTRGREKSRTIDEVLDDCARLVAAGVREITLLGQNVNSFGKGNLNEKGREPQELHNIIGKVGPRAGEENFPQLLRAMDQDPRLKGLQRIRYTSSHPLDFSDELIECYAPLEKGGVSKLSAHLHLPVQAGSNRVLQKMGRHHQIEGYIAQMDRLRELNPDVGLSTDLIVGFPTETEEEFQETMRLLERVQYDNIYAFAYSPRPGTRAAKLPDDVPSEVKRDRLNRLLAHQMKIAETRYASRIGKVMGILVEGLARNQNILRNAGHLGDASDSGRDATVAPGLRTAADAGRVWTGRTECNRVVNFVSDDGRNLVGRIVPVEITDSTALSLVGKLFHDSDYAERASS